MKRNQHNTLIKQVVTIEDDVKRLKKLEEHNSVAKCMKNDIQEREKKLSSLETDLVSEALKLPNKTHLDSPIGGEDSNKLVKEVEAKKGIKQNVRLSKGLTHIEIAE